MSVTIASPHGAAPGPHDVRVMRDGERRLLLISYHFPPSPEVGALRWQHLARFAAERGWALDVVALDPWQLAAPDWSALSDLPIGVAVHGVREGALPLDRLVRRVVALRHRRQARRSAAAGAAAPTPQVARPPSLGVEELRSPLHSSRDALRAFHAWRSYVQQRAWAGHAATVAWQLSRAQRYRGVITCGPPHMAHEAGRMLQHRTGVPLVVDMRDLWSLTPRLSEEIASPLALRLARRHERRVVSAATLIVTNTEPSRLAMQAAYPAARNRIIAILNGYDDEPVPPSEHGRCFIIGYAGSIYLDRDPRPLIHAAAGVIHDLRLGPEEFRVEFMGVEPGHATLVAHAAAERGIAEFVRTYPPAPRADVKRFLARATMLASLPLISLSSATDTSIPAKLFEYTRFRAWLLALANPGSATALLLRDTGAEIGRAHV